MIKVTTIGGGTGQHVLLRGLKNYDAEISAIVSMADDGGSTGKLRDELGVHAVGDIRQCLLALSKAPKLWLDLMGYRFESGSLYGHSFGNLFLSALEKVTGNFEEAIDQVAHMLNVQGRVIPVTKELVRLAMVLSSGQELYGERQIYLSEEIAGGYSNLYLDPVPAANPLAVEKIMDADLVVVGPGGLFTSILANILVEGVCEALVKTSAVKVFVVNLMNRKGQTMGFGVKRYLEELQRWIGRDVFDYILVNDETPPLRLMEAYAKEGELVYNDLDDPRVVCAPMLGKLGTMQKSDIMQRNPIRHDSKKLAFELMQIVKRSKECLSSSI